MEMPGGLVYGTNLTAAVRGGTVKEEVRLSPTIHVFIYELKTIT